MPPLTPGQRTLVAANVKLARWAVGRYARPGQDRDDALSAAFAGLVYAAGRFDPGLGFRFATYAAWWMRQVISRDAALDRRRSFRQCPAGPPLGSLNALRTAHPDFDLLAAKGTDPAVGLDFADAVEGFKWLTGREQEAVRLQFLDGLTLAEAGGRASARNGPGDSAGRGWRS